MLHTLESIVTMVCQLRSIASAIAGATKVFAGERRMRLLNVPEYVSPLCRGTACALLASKRVQTKKADRENGALKFEYRYWCGLTKAGSMVPADMLEKDPFERDK